MSILEDFKGTLPPNGMIDAISILITTHGKAVDEDTDDFNNIRIKVRTCIEETERSYEVNCSTLQVLLKTYAVDNQQDIIALANSKSYLGLCGGKDLGSVKMLFGEANPFMSNILSRKKLQEICEKETKSLSHEHNKFKMFQNQQSLPSNVLDIIPDFRKRLLVSIAQCYAKENVQCVELSLRFKAGQRYRNILKELIVIAHEVKERNNVDIRFLLMISRNKVLTPVKFESFDETKKSLINNAPSLTKIINSLLNLSDDELSYIAGFDLAGDEIKTLGCSFLHSDFIRFVSKRGLGLRIHFGEITKCDISKNTPDLINIVKTGFASLSILLDNNIKVAVGHGIFLMEWINELVTWCEPHILMSIMRDLYRIEVCPLSNWYLVCNDDKEIKLRISEMIKAGLNVVIGSDDPLFFTKCADLLSYFRIPSDNVPGNDFVVTLQYMFLAYGDNAIDPNILKEIALRSCSLRFLNNGTYVGDTKPNDESKSEHASWIEHSYDSIFSSNPFINKK